MEYYAAINKSNVPLYVLIWKKVHAILFHLKKINLGVPTMAQWVENLTAVAWIALEIQVQSLAQYNELKDLVKRSAWQHRSLL